MQNSMANIQGDSFVLNFHDRSFNLKPTIYIKPIFPLAIIWTFKTFFARDKKIDFIFIKEFVIKSWPEFLGHLVKKMGKGREKKEGEIAREKINSVEKYKNEKKERRQRKRGKGKKEDRGREQRKLREFDAPFLSVDGSVITKASESGCLIGR